MMKRLQRTAQKTVNRPLTLLFPVALACSLVLLLMVGLGTQISQATPISYVLDDNRQPVPAPQGYVFDRYVHAPYLREPTFLLLNEEDGEEYLYVADTGGHTIYKMDLQGNQLLAVSAVGGRRFQRPSGLFVRDDGHIFVADTGNGRITELNPAGDLVREIGLPYGMERLGRDYVYAPVDILIPGDGYVYVTSDGDYRGLMRVDMQGNWRGTFAAIHIPFSLGRYISRLFLTREQREAQLREFPNPHTRVTRGDEGFLYAVSEYQTTNQIQKLNVVGDNIFPKGDYGQVVHGRVLGSDYFGQRYWTRTTRSRFVDITVTETGIISVIDATWNQIHQYDQLGNNLTVFAGAGTGNGLFRRPTSIAHDSREYLYVLDSDTSMIQVFRPTELMRMVHQATYLDHNALYEEAERIWRDVLRLNANYAVAHRGLGRVYEKIGDFDKALYHYRQGDYTGGYSRVMQRQRYHYMTQNFSQVVMILAAIVLGIYILTKVLRVIDRSDKARSNLILGTVAHFVAVLKRPRSTFDELKQNGTVGMALIIYSVVITLRVLNLWFTGFLFAPVERADIQIITEVALITAPVALWLGANAAIASVTGGRGSMRDILVGTAFALAPYVLISPIVTVLSNILVQSEAGIINTLWSVAYIWAAVLVVLSVRFMHDFEIGRAVGLCAAMVFGTLCLAAVVVFSYGIANQAVTLIRDLVLESMVRWG